MRQLKMREVRHTTYMEKTCWFLPMTTFLFLVQLCFIANLSMATAQTSLTNLTTVTRDQSALLALKSHITSDPHSFINWSTNTPVCNWAGVTCSARHHRVAVLDLSNLGLTATVPPELGNLSFLVALRLENNSFHGPLPEELAHLHRLKLINLGYNNFMGTIPSWFGSLSKLQGFYLYGNRFSGSIPASIFNLSELQTFHLYSNQLSGSIPREIGNLTMLKQIYLDYNNFKEKIPNEIGTLVQLEELSLQGNALKGLVPMAIFNRSSLTAISLSRNSLRGNLPENICHNLPKLQLLYLPKNQFEGALPSNLGQCKQLLRLSLGNNNFSGSIPRNIGNLTQITYIHLGYNYFTGTIPHEIGALQKIEVLSLGHNSLHGIIPSTFFNMSSIIAVDITFNLLSGNLPKNIGLDIPNLQELYIGANNLSGVIPNFISNASKLIKLDMGLNSFSGFIPVTLCTLPNLQWLLLPLNNLTIDTSTPEPNIFSCLANLRNLKRLSLAGNPFSTTLPASLGNLSTSLQYIDFRSCNLKGDIPKEIGNLSSLISLHLGFNQLSGSLPTTLGRLQSLQGLYLNDNKLQGYIPDELCLLYNLADMEMPRNLLSGSIPSCLGDLATSLRRLNLRSNLLHSTVPSFFWELKHILKLDLSSNSLVGSLSEHIGNLKVVTYINLSNNLFSGSIPSSIGGLQDLVSLSLANNNLEGLIPSSFGSSLSLEVLDLSDNSLSGVIPKSLEALLHLRYLNLSFNKLQGEIPTGGRFRNFSSESFVPNGALCGETRLLVVNCKMKEASKSIAKYVIIGTLSAILIVVLVLILCRKRNVEVVETNLPPQQLLWKEVSQFELLRATDGLSESNLLGTGGFSLVYKGTMSDGINVAIKVFNLEVEGISKSFENECEMLSNIRHRNILSIISCCSQADFKAVVLNYMPNGSLDNFLYSKNSSLNILQRLDILIDVASALEYLHHGCATPIIHCDLKPSNILLDDDMVAHVADFGIAKLLGGGNFMTHTLTLATIGYMAPEYGTEGTVSRRGDVYSFGIVLMETFTKRKPTDEMFGGEKSLKQWVADSLFQDGIVEVVDTDLFGTQEDDDFMSKRDCLSSLMRLALMCCAESPEKRLSMQDALAILNNIKNKFLKDAAEGEKLNFPLAEQPLIDKF